MTLAYLIDGQRFKVAVEGTVIKRDAFKALEDARALLQECELLEKRLREEGDRAREAERDRGFRMGQSEGLAQCSQRLAEIELEAARYLGALDDKLVRLVMQVVRRVAPKISARQLVPDLVEEALKEVRAERFLVVRVHPDNCEAVRKRLKELKQAYPMFELVEVLGDAEMGAFDCSMESEAGVVRADLELQLNAIERALKQSFAAQRSSE